MKCKVFLLKVKSVVEFGKKKKIRKHPQMVFPPPLASFQAVHPAGPVTRVHRFYKIIT